MALPCWVSVFDVSDDDHEFASYLSYLREQGLRPTSIDWLREVAQRLMGLDTAGGGSANPVDPAWTLDRRRLLVALTWPDANGALVPRLSIVDDDDHDPSGISGLTEREYPELWADIGRNLESLAWRADERGYLGRLADPDNRTADVFWESARLGLIATQSGDAVSTAVVDALRSRHEEWISRAQEGFVLTWWDIVAVAECTGFYFEPFNSDDARKRVSGSNGRYLWDRSGLLRRLGRARRRVRDTSASIARQESDEEARRSPALEPAELHRRITAGGRIEPPPEGSKYRALFEYLDAIDFIGMQATVTLSCEQLDELTSHIESQSPRIVRGARGCHGLPQSALSNVQWWYGPWNPEHADEAAKWNAVAESSWPVLMRSKSQSRAWMAAGIRARPNWLKGKKLVSVQFAPINGREYWWPWRAELRDDTYGDLVELRPQ